MAGSGNHLDFKFRGYDPRLGKFWSVDPKAAKFPSYSPYAFCLNNPGILTDPNGQEPIPYYRRWLFEPRKPWQWYWDGASPRLSVWDAETFHSAAVYSTQHQRASAYQTVYQRMSYYSWVQGQSDAKGYGSKWFGAAALVTDMDGVGAVDNVNFAYMHDNTESFLRGGNEFLFPHNMNNAKDLLADGELSGGFMDANGKRQSFEGLTGMALDYKMVEFEQSKVQEYINNYKGNDLGEIITEINELMTDSWAPGAVRDVMKESFTAGKPFNFRNYNDRVKLGQGLIENAHK